LKPTSATQVVEIINAIQAFNDSTMSSKWLVQPTIKIYSDVVSIENGDEVRGSASLRKARNLTLFKLLDTLLRTLRVLNEGDFTETANSFPQPYATYPDLDSTTLSPFSLPSVLVPPEIIELDGLSADSEEEAQVKKEEWPEYFLRLFDNDVRYSFSMRN
jgi:nuclear cap-binding protein subunit 1